MECSQFPKLLLENKEVQRYAISFCCELRPYSQSILKNILCLFIKDLMNLKVTQLLIFTSQKLCYFPMLQNIEKMEKKTKYIIMNDWWIQPRI